MPTFIITTRGLHYAYVYAVTAENEEAAEKKVEAQLCENESIENTEGLELVLDHFISIPLDED